jgi:hypothetical protein
MCLAYKACGVAALEVKQNWLQIRQKVIRLAGEGMTKAAVQPNIGEATIYRILAAVPKENHQVPIAQSNVFFEI